MCIKNDCDWHTACVLQGPSCWGSFRAGTKKHVCCGRRPPCQAWLMGAVHALTKTLCNIFTSASRRFVLIGDSVRAQSLPHNFRRTRYCCIAIRTAMGKNHKDTWGDAVQSVASLTTVNYPHPLTPWYVTSEVLTLHQGTTANQSVEIYECLQSSFHCGAARKWRVRSENLNCS